MPAIVFLFAGMARSYNSQPNLPNFWVRALKQSGIDHE